MGSLTLLLTIPIFIFGLAIGSFVNVVVMRTLREEDFLRGRSKCDHCGRILKWYEMIPLLSYIILRGRCRTCHQEIDIMHPVVELLVGALFVWWWLIGSAFFELTTNLSVQIVQPLFWLLAGLIMLTIAIIDWQSSYIPDWLTQLLFWLVIGYRLFLLNFGWYQPRDLAWSMAGATSLTLFFLFLFLITKKRGFGFGDVKLVFPLALLMGWPEMLIGIWLAFVSGALYGVGLILARQKKFGQTIPFGPFLILGTFLGLIYGNSLLSWYLSLL